MAETTIKTVDLRGMLGAIAEMRETNKWGVILDQ